MTPPEPQFERKDIGSANVQFPSGSSMPDWLDVAVDPYAPTKRTVGTKVKGFQAWPQKRGSFPAVVILHERWGLTQHFQELTYRLARYGYVALAVDQYTRIGSVVTTDEEHAGELMTKLNPAQLMQDLAAAVEYLNYQDYVKKNRIAVLGFGMGGTHALRFAGSRRQLRACIAFYGNVPPDALSMLRCPVQYHQPEHDEGVPPQEVDALCRQLETQKAVCEIIRYPGVRHGFFNQTRATVYDEAAATQAWVNSLAFLERYILAEHAGVRPLPDSQRQF